MAQNDTIGKRYLLNIILGYHQLDFFSLVTKVGSKSFIAENRLFFTYLKKRKYCDNFFVKYRAPTMRFAHMVNK